MPSSASEGAARDAGRPLARVFLLPAALSLALALWAGLSRFAFGPEPPLAVYLGHGPLLVSGFLGTLIGVERAVALGGRAAALVPFASALGAAALVLGLPLAPAPFALASAGSVLIALAVLRREPSLHAAIMTTGAVSWLIGNVLWLGGRPPALVVHWWEAFLVLTIAGERLELGRVLRPSPIARATLAGAVLLLGGGLVRRTVDHAAGGPLLGAGLGAVALWLAVCDVARRTIRRPGLPRYTAASLLAGYAWLAAGGALVAARGEAIMGPDHDAHLHAVFVGFALSMVFGHAPIVLPAVTGVTLPWRRAFYAPLVLLHASLVVRVAGDLLPSMPARRIGGALNVTSVVVFLATALASIVAQRVAARRSPHVRTPRAPATS